MTATPAGVTLDLEELSTRHRRELHVHCYRMLASFDEAEDAVQETFLRAWRSLTGDTRGDTAGRSPQPEQPRAWLYRIATNICIDVIRQRGRQATRSMADLPWLSPYPDRLLDELAPPAEQPEEVAVGRETIELAFLAAMQALPPRQRAAFLVRDVLGWPAADTARLLATSVPAANSALQRARVTMQERLPARRAEWTAAGADVVERDLLARFIEAHERGDAEAAVAIAAPDLRITMPPRPFLFEGRDVIAKMLRTSFGPESEGQWRLLPARLNRMPAAASYLKRHGDTRFRAFKFDLLRIGGGQVREITTLGPALFGRCGLPEVLAEDEALSSPRA